MCHRGKSPLTDVLLQQLQTNICINECDVISDIISHNLTLHDCLVVHLT